MIVFAKIFNFFKLKLLALFPATSRHVVVTSDRHAMIVCPCRLQMYRARPARSKNHLDAWQDVFKGYRVFNLC